LRQIPKPAPHEAEAGIESDKGPPQKKASKGESKAFLNQFLQP
jgi:hypothetical protein